MFGFLKKLFGKKDEGVGEEPASMDEAKKQDAELTKKEEEVAEAVK
ncbi:hypothetical protein GOV08_04360 [Candidatus Woesearchaeota archaeon]|nr:hypothetical protein [Candidatus Woesearchaeota archaeon]